MKKIKIFATVVFAALGLNTLEAQDHSAVKPENPKETIKVTEKEEKKVVHKGITYYVIDGMWHTKMKNKYILKTAPEGARTNFIPKGGKLVTLAGKKYYKCRGVFYKKLKDGFYEIDRP